jgi:hypothetical protein
VGIPFLKLNIYPARNITTEVSTMTMITSHRSISRRRDFTINAAINTATMPGFAIDTDAFL